MPRLLLFILLVLTPFQLQAASAVKARTLAGVGVVRIPANVYQDGVTLYSEPGIGRLQTLPLAALPALRQLGIALDSFCLPVMAKKRGWLKVIIDDSERTGWLEMGRGWEFSSWEHFLANRQAAMLKGIRKDYYLLRKEAAVRAEPVGTVEKGPLIQLQQIDREWARVESGNGFSGWLRWRDENGRLLLTVAAEPLSP
jgi:hypothetical protein